MIVPGIAGIVTNLILPWITGRSAYGAIGPYFALSFVAIIGHALIRRRITDLRLVLHDGLTLALATFVSLIPAIVLLELFGSRVFGHLVGIELALVLVTIVLVILIAPPTRDIARRLLDRYVYRTRANYQRTVREASRALTRMLDLKRLLPFISNDGRRGHGRGRCRHLSVGRGGLPAGAGASTHGGERVHGAADGAGVGARGAGPRAGCGGDGRSRATDRERRGSGPERRSRRERLGAAAARHLGRRSDRVHRRGLEAVRRSVLLAGS